MSIDAYPRVEVVNLTRGLTIEGCARVAVSRRVRMRGLIGLKEDEAHALVLFGCRNVHTWGMSFPLDLVFWGKDGVVLRTVEGLPPRRLSPLVMGARGVVELLPGTLLSTGTRPGDRISVRAMIDGSQMDLVSQGSPR